MEITITLYSSGKCKEKRQEKNILYAGIIAFIPDFALEKELYLFDKF
jgi:hypothetical protein